MPNFAILFLAFPLLGLSAASELRIVSSDGTLGPEPCALTCAGTTKRDATGWIGWDGYLIVFVDISACQFTDVPIVTVTLNGDYEDTRMAGASAIYRVDNTGFYMRLRGYVKTAYSIETYKVQVDEAKRWGWSIDWIATGFHC